MGKISFSGNNRFSDFKLAFRYNIWDYFLFPTRIGRGYHEQDLSQNLKDLLHFYRNSGFPECLVSQSLTVDTLKLESSIDVLVDEGPKYEWDLSSVDPFRRDEVRKAFNFNKRGNFRDVALIRGVHTLEHKLSDWGYEEAQIEIEDTIITKNDREERHIRPVVKVKPRVEINSISFYGVESLKLNNIKRKMWLSDRIENRKGRGVYTAELLSDDISTIEAYYRAEGFYKTTIKTDVIINSDSKACDLSIKINEGNATRINRIKVKGIDNLILNGNPNGEIKAGDRFKEKKIDALIKRYATSVSEKGYPDVKVLCDIHYTSDSSMVDINIDVEKGEFKKIGEVFFSGNFRTKYDYLLKESELKPNNPYIASEISKAMSSIRNTGLFERVYYKAYNDSIDPKIKNVKIFLSEKEALSLNGAFGYETESRSYLKFNAANRNIFGYNKTLSINGILAFDEQYIGLKYVEPDFIFRKSSFWTNIYFKSEQMIDRKVFSRKLGNSYGIVKKILNKSEVSLGISYERRKMDTDLNLASLPDTLSISLIDNARHVLSLKPKIVLDARDSFIRPKKGGYATFRGDISNGLNSSNSDDYLNAILDLRAYIPFFKSTVIALRVKGEGITPYGSSDSIAVDQLLTIGGNSSVRGYAKDKLYRISNGDKMVAMSGFITVNSNIELRVEFAKFFEAMVFVDGGSLAPQAKIETLQKPRFSVGPGLSVLTPIGPIGLAYGFKINKAPDQKLGELHFSIGYIF